MVKLYSDLRTMELISHINNGRRGASRELAGYLSDKLKNNRELLLDEKNLVIDLLRDVSENTEKQNFLLSDRGGTDISFKIERSYMIYVHMSEIMDGIITQGEAAALTQEWMDEDPWIKKHFGKSIDTTGIEKIYRAYKEAGYVY